MNRDLILPSPELKNFIAAHLADNTDKLLLGAAKYPAIDVPFAVEQILIRRHIKEKLPAWFDNGDLIFPSRIAAEQCSSETTALYKQRLIKGESVCDLTGGMGVDSYYFSLKTKKVYYIERYAEYCDAAETNFKTLGAENIRVINADSRDLMETLPVDTFYIDPARRSDGNKRLFALTECEPDVLQLKPVLLGNDRRLIVKISPMADISETLRLLPETTEVHILSVKNECKELLFVLENPDRIQKIQPPVVYTVNFTPFTTTQEFAFTLEEERESMLVTTGALKKYLYEPNASLLKGGAFKLTALRYGIEKLHQHSHLYTSGELVAGFPGRSFRIVEEYPFSGKILKQIHKQLPRANITVRNFPLTVAEIRKRSGITEGGNTYLFATTLADGSQKLVETEKI